MKAEFWIFPLTCGPFEIKDIPSVLKKISV